MIEDADKAIYRRTRPHKKLDFLIYINTKDEVSPNQDNQCNSL
jgi:hypothetical protein